MKQTLLTRPYRQHLTASPLNMTARCKCFYQQYSEMPRGSSIKDIRTEGGGRRGCGQKLTRGRVGSAYCGRPHETRHRQPDTDPTEPWTSSISSIGYSVPKLRPLLSRWRQLSLSCAFSSPLTMHKSGQPMRLFPVAAAGATSALWSSTSLVCTLRCSQADALTAAFTTQLTVWARRLPAQRWRWRCWYGNSKAFPHSHVCGRLQRGRKGGTGWCGQKRTRGREG